MRCTKTQDFGKITFAVKESAIPLLCSVCALLDCRSSSQPSTVCTPARWIGQAWSAVQKAIHIVCQTVLHLVVSATPCCVMTATAASTPNEEPQGSAAASSSAIAGNGSTEPSAISGEPGPSEAGTSSSAPSTSAPAADEGTLLKVSAFLQ